MIRNKTLSSVLALLIAAPALANEAPAVFSGPQEATDAFIAGVAEGDVPALLEVFGSDAEDLLLTGSPGRDAVNRIEILTLFNEGYRFVRQEDGTTVLVLGEEAWPFPIPLAQTDAGWSFDVAAGRDEVLFRRIGLNELDVLELMQTYVDIQAEYRLIDHDGDGVMEFAASVLSSSDEARDGLVWATRDTPLGVAVARASLDGYFDGETDQPPEPFGGYYFRILTEQGDNAPGGAMGYMINDNMVAGHALLAVPADYGDSGVHSFMVAENGIIFEADLGEETLDVAAEMTSFDPGEAWSPLQ